MNLEKISGFDAIKGISSALGSERTHDAFSSGATEQSSFAKFVETAVNDVNSKLNLSDAKQVDVATGRSENLHDAMITYEKAESALKLLVQVRNKVLEAYHEVMRMQV